jgi:hypothetical protein
MGRRLIVNEFINVNGPGFQHVIKNKEAKEILKNSLSD